MYNEYSMDYFSMLMEFYQMALLIYTSSGEESKPFSVKMV